MALIQESEGATYVSNFNGKFEVRVKAGTPGSIEREKKDGNKIHVLNYKAVRGIITDIKKDVTEYKGKKMVSLKIFLSDGDEKLILSFPYNSGLTTAFYRMLENIDFDREVEFSSSVSEDSKGKEKTNLFIQQDGVNLKWRYTKKWAEENPKAPKKPEWVQNMVKGDFVWDNTAEIQFFEGIMKEKILPVLRAKAPASQPATASHVLLVMDDDDFPEGPKTDDDRIPGEEPPFTNSPF